MKSFSLLTFFTCAFVVIIIGEELKREGEEIKSESNVVILTQTNWDYVVTSDVHILVEFYAPWCHHCKLLAPEYANAATTLKEVKSDIILAKVDAILETELAEKFNVESYPTIKFFKKGTMIDYEGGRTSDEIIDWLDKKSAPPATVLQDESILKAFVDARDSAVVGFFFDDKSELGQAFLKAGEVLEDYDFGITTVSAGGQYTILHEKIVVFKKFDDLEDLRSDYEGEANVDDIVKFVRSESLALVTEYTDEAASKIFGGDIKTHVLLFISKKSPAFRYIFGNYKIAAMTFKGSVLFVYIDIDLEENQTVLEFFQLKMTEVPALRLLQLEGEMSRFAPDTRNLDTASITAFVKKFVDGKLKPHLMSEEIPDDWDYNPVKVVVAKSFQEVVFDNEKDVFVMFYAPWCGHCEELAPLWEQLGTHFRDHASLDIAKMDSTLNEVGGLDIPGFPTLKYFHHGVGIDYNGKRDLDDLVKFVESQLLLKYEEESQLDEAPPLPMGGKDEL